LDNKVGLGGYTIVWAVKVSNKINYEQKYTAALGGCQTTNKHSNQPKTPGYNGRGTGFEALPGKDIREAGFHHFGSNHIGRR
jgi:hypothetical protein